MILLTPGKPIDFLQLKITCGGRQIFTEFAAPLNQTGNAFPYKASLLTSDVSVQRPLTMGKIRSFQTRTYF